MGIQGLLPLLKSIMVPIHIKDLEGCSVAIDTYSWLHKGALSCSKDLCNSQPTSKHIDYCMHRVNLLRHYGVKPILVFDGGHLPMKNDQEIKRARSRKENLARAIEHESCGNKSAAYECYQKAVDISPAIAYELIQVLKQENISYVVAPYEADAQMTFLAISKQVDAVITEDSDLIPFGCPRIIYKMDKFGQGVQFQYSKLQHNKDLNFTGFTKQMILEMCILSGCDYLQSLPGMGLKKAHALIKKFKSYGKVTKHLKFSGIVVPPLYEESFRKAIMTFQHQRVYDPFTQDVVHLSELSENVDEDLDFLGPLIPQNIAKGIASGDIDPLTKLPIQGECVEAGPLFQGTYNLKGFKTGDESKKLDLPAQKNLLTNYFCFASLEAKRKFKAPRVSPKHPNSTNGTPQTPKDISEEAEEPVNARKASNLLESLSHDDTRNPSIHPCKALQKDPESNSLFNGIEGKTRAEKKTVIVRSSYFKHKTVTDDVQENRPNVVVTSALEFGDGESGKGKNEHIVKSSYFQRKNVQENNQEEKMKLLAGENLAFDCEPMSVLDSAEVKTRVESKKSNISPYFRHNNQENTIEKVVEMSTGIDTYRNSRIHCDLDMNYNENGSVLDSAEVKTRVESKKSNISPYFRHKNQDNTSEKAVEMSNGIDTYRNRTIRGDLDMNRSEGSTMKRKYSVVDDNAQKENMNPKHTRTSQSPASEGGCNSDVEDQMPTTRTEEEKFGCNIAHLGRYSEIAEKSMEKFISVISSFRCTSSGSRASGLRPPLKDVNNIRTNTPSTSKDFSEFAYVPTKKLPFRRR